MAAWLVLMPDRSLATAALALIAFSPALAGPFGRALCDILTSGDLWSHTAATSAQSIDDRPNYPSSRKSLAGPGSRSSHHAPWTGFLDFSRSIESCEDRWRPVFTLALFVLAILLAIRAHSIAVVWHHHLDLKRKSKFRHHHTPSRSRSITCPLPLNSSSPFTLPDRSPSHDQPKLFILPSSYRHTPSLPLPPPYQNHESCTVTSNNRRNTLPNSNHRPNAHHRVNSSSSGIVVYAPVLMSWQDAERWGGKEAILIDEPRDVKSDLATSPC